MGCRGRGKEVDLGRGACPPAQSGGVGILSWLSRVTGRSSSRAAIQTGAHRGRFTAPQTAERGCTEPASADQQTCPLNVPAAKPTDGGAALAFPFLFRTILAAEPSAIR